MEEKKRKEKGRKIKKQNKGITLVALVITIIIIIILATVTINMAFGDNGLIKQAELAKDMTANSTVAEQEGMNSLMDEYANLLAEDSEIPVEPTIPTTIAEAKENGTKFTETTPLKDDLGNTVYIPGGFHVDKEDSGTIVEDGIVIEDDTENQNQFVWIPTGTYKTTDTEEPTKTNELTRRQWATTANTVQEPTPITGDEVADGYNGQYYYGEGDSRSCTISNGVNSIDAFLSSAKPLDEGGHGGFYIGRYEQGTGNVCKAGVEPYVNVTRDEAKTAAESMYSGNTNIKTTSQLISSYAWDTALNFICQNSEYGYELATTTDDKYGNIGTEKRKNTGVDANDDYSNIHDLLGNCCEVTTEYSSGSYSGSARSSVSRGSFYFYSGFYAANRFYPTANTTATYSSFRLQIYI